MNILMSFEDSWSDFERSLNWLKFKYWMRENGWIVLVIIAIIIIVIIVAHSSKKNCDRNRYYNSQEYSKSQEYNAKLKSISDEKENNRLLREGGWKCQKCEKINPKYQTSCVCGQSKETNEIMRQTKNTDEIKRQLEAYKQMLDEGLITQEKFVKKKKTLLGI